MDASGGALSRRVVRRGHIAICHSLTGSASGWVSSRFAALDNVALVAFGRGVLHSGDFLVGLLLTGYGVFMVLGPMALGRVGGRIRMELALYAAYLALGAGTVLTGLSPVIAVAFVGQAIAGAGAGWCHIAVDTLIQQHVPARSLGTVYIFPYAAEVLTYLAGAGVVAAAGARWTLLISGIGVLATLALVAPALSRAERPASRTTWAGTRDARV